MTSRAILSVLCCLLLRGPAWAGATTLELLNALPPVIKDTTKAAPCTVTFLVSNVTTNDMIAVRMRIAPDVNDQAVNNLMPCPPNIPPRVASAGGRKPLHHPRGRSPKRVRFRRHVAGL